MHKFIDEIAIRVKAGDGGAGCVSYRREKYIPRGGPDGGDGGHGGNVYIKADQNILNLSHLRKDILYHAQNGRGGTGQNKSGKKGEDIIIKVPIGTQIFNETSDNIIHDFLDEEIYCAAEGARGGKGNAFFKSATNQSPRFAQPGEKTEEIKINLSLKLIADAGLVGMPNAGKSTLLKTLTRANPKVGNYPFTTLTPNLGVLEIDNKKRIFIADIPGIIEGASRGHGLGLSFLKHIERVKVLIFVLDVSAAHVEEELKILRHELEEYNPQLLKRPYIVAFNKVDLLADKEFLNEWVMSFEKEGIHPLPISATKKEGIHDLIEEIKKKL
ncbi:MAG: GTPase ObgE [Spirochaetia bacterium]|nr:GTPase ObgE [Spirochaetia bacterium]